MDDNKKPLDQEAKNLLSDLLNLDGDLVPVQKDEFLPGLALPTDVFVQAGSGKFIMIAKKGQNASLQDLHVSKNSDVATFYVRRDDYLSAVDQNLKIAGILVRRQDIPLPRRSGFLRTATNSVFKEMEHLGLIPEALEHSKTAVNAVVTLVQSREDYFSLVKSLDDLPGQIIKDAIAGASLSVCIAKEMGWVNTPNMQKLALAAFLRDIGMKDLPSDITEKPRQELAGTPRALWETHPDRGVEILRSIQDMPAEVIAVCLEHHENAVGQGFPRKIRDMKMHPFAKIVSLADTFSDLTLHKDRKIPQMDKDRAMEHIEYVLGSPFNKSCIIALKRALDIRPAGSRPNSDKPDSSGDGSAAS